MITNLTQFAASSSGIGALGVDSKALIIQIITFLLAFWALQHWAFKPILKIMERRRETIEKGVKLGEQMQKEKVELEKKVAEALHEARTDADKILSEAHDAGRQAVAEAEEAARKKADGVLAAAEDRIKQDTSAARRKLEKDLAGLVAEATEAVIGEKVDAKKDAVLIDKALKARGSA